MRLALALLASLLLAAPASAQVTTLAPTYATTVDRNVSVPMEDGTKLAADVHRPLPQPWQPADQRFPCLFEMTPYGKEARAAKGAGAFPPRGFVLMEVDVRGTGASEGEYGGIFTEAEQRDGYDAIEWLATQYPYCNGHVGMFGGSYSGINQYLVAASPKGTPPHLRTIAPQRALTDLYRDIVYTGGILTASFGLIWSGGTEAYKLAGADPRTSQPPEQAVRALVDQHGNDPMFTTYMARPFDSPAYRAASAIDRVERLDLPIFHLEGWFDAFTRGQLQLVERLLELERGGRVRGPSYAVVGPWNHGGSHFVAHEAFHTRLVEWYQHWLDGGPQPLWFSEPRVTYCEMRGGLNGACFWRQAAAWPPPGTRHRRVWLQPGGGLGEARPLKGDAALGWWFFDPATGSGEAAFETPALERDLVVTGPIELRLRARTDRLPPSYGPPQGITGLWAEQVLPDQLDTDFVVKLSDVRADGTSTLIQSGFLRASHRAVDEGRSRPGQPFHPHDPARLLPVEAGAPTEYRIEVRPTSKRFRAGHRLRIALSSADTPNRLTRLTPVVSSVLAGSYLMLPEQRVSAKRSQARRKR